MDSGLAPRSYLLDTTSSFNLSENYGNSLDDIFTSDDKVRFSHLKIMIKIEVLEKGLEILANEFSSDLARWIKLELQRNKKVKQA